MTDDVVAQPSDEAEIEGMTRNVSTYVSTCTSFETRSAAQEPQPSSACKRSSQLDRALTSFDRRVGRLESWSTARVMANKAMSHVCMDAFLAALIAFNMALVVAETNYAADGEDHLPHWMTTLSVVILTVYCCEVAIRMYIERENYFKSPMNLFDLVVIVMDVGSTILRLAFDLESSIPVEVFRLARIMKIVRTVRLMILFPELRLLLQCLAYAIKAIIWAVLMMIVVLGFWGIFAVMLIHPLNKELAEKGYWEQQQCERCPRAFESVQQAMLTFSQIVIIGDNWGLVTLPLIEHYPLTGFFFFGVLISLSMGVMNLILAVIVERAVEAKETSLKDEAEKKEKAFLRASDRLLNLCKAIDQDGNGQLTFDELWAGFQSNPEFASIMTAMDMREADLEILFHILDTDGSKTIDYKEFVDQLHLIKEQESHTLLIFIKFYVMEIRRNLRKLSKKATSIGSPPKPSGPIERIDIASPALAAGAEASARSEPTIDDSCGGGGGGGGGDFAGMISTLVKQSMDVLSMQAELSDELRCQAESCQDRIRSLESMVASSLGVTWPRTLVGSSGGTTRAKDTEACVKHRGDNPPAEDANVAMSGEASFGKSAVRFAAAAAAPLASTYDQPAEG